MAILVEKMGSPLPIGPYRSDGLTRTGMKFTFQIRGFNSLVNGAMLWQISIRDLILLPLKCLIITFMCKV